MDGAEPPERRIWKRDLAAYRQPDRARSVGQISGVLVPYLGVWALAAVTGPSPLLAIGLGLIATVFLVRMYSLFHDLTHNSLFASRRANAVWGHALGYLLFTPYRWWQRQHSLHHAHTGNLDHRGAGEIFTMTVAEYERASRLRRLAYRAYRHPLLMLLVGPALVFLFERRFPQRGMSRRILLSVLATNGALAGWAIGWSAVVGWETFLLIQGTTLVAGGAVAAWMLYIQHQYEDTYYGSGDEWRFELAALQGSSYLRLPRWLAWVVGNANYHHVHHLSARIPNYRLRAVHEGHPMFARTPVVTLRASAAAFGLKLWDEKASALVPFPDRLSEAARGILEAAEGVDGPLRPRRQRRRHADPAVAGSTASGQSRFREYEMQMNCPSCGTTQGATVFSSFHLQRCPTCRERGLRSYLAASASLRPASHGRNAIHSESRPGDARG